MNACREKDFIGVSVADGAERRLVHEKDTRLVAPARNQLFEAFECELPGEYVHALLAVAGDGIIAARGHEVDLPHLLLIPVAKQFPAVQRQGEAEVRDGLFGLCGNLEPAGEHASA